MIGWNKSINVTGKVDLSRKELNLLKREEKVKILRVLGSFVLVSLASTMSHQFYFAVLISSETKFLNSLVSVYSGKSMTS